MQLKITKIQKSIVLCFDYNKQKNFRNISKVFNNFIQNQEKGFHHYYLCQKVL